MHCFFHPFHQTVQLTPIRLLVINLRHQRTQLTHLGIQPSNLVCIAGRSLTAVVYLREVLRELLL